MNGLRDRASGTGPVPPRASDRWAGPWAVALTLVFIVAIAAILRFVDLASNPGGLFPDEAAEGLAARQLLHTPGFYPVWFPDDGGREALFAYVVAAVFRLAGESVVALRSTSAGLGVLGVVTLWFLARRFGGLAGVAGAAWAAGSLWLVAISRDGMRNVLVPLLGAVALLALLEWQSRPSHRRAAIAGVMTALAALYTYQPLKLLPIVVILWLVWLRRADRPSYESLRRGLLPFAIAFLVTALPMLVVAATQPANYFGRAAAVSPFNPDVQADDNVVVHVLRTVGMFLVTGDPNARHDVDGLPLFGWLPLGFLVFGLAALGVWHLWRIRRQPAAALVLLSLGVFLLAPVVAVEGGSPHFLRSLGLAAPLGVAVGLGAADVVHRVDTSEPAGALRVSAVATTALVLATLGTTAIASGVAYLGRPASSRADAFDYGLVALAADVAGEGPQVAVVLDENRATVVRFLDSVDAPTILDPATQIADPRAFRRVVALTREDLIPIVGASLAARATPLSVPKASGDAAPNGDGGPTAAGTPGGGGPSGGGGLGGGGLGDGGPTAPGTPSGDGGPSGGPTAPGIPSGDGGPSPDARLAGRGWPPADAALLDGWQPTQPFAWQVVP